MSTIQDRDALDGTLDMARQLIDSAGKALTIGSPEPGRLHAAVEGAHQVATGLAGLVATLIERVPIALGDRGGGRDSTRLANEVIADLRAMHGCLTTGARLLAPALDDLHGLATPTPAKAAVAEGARTLDDEPDSALAVRTHLNHPERPAGLGGRERGTEPLSVVEADPAVIAPASATGAEPPP